ncbi:MAG: 3-oxoacyl-ACP reductase FabG [Chloroflexi bacterium]|nr:3-oxoacyl-ACP reductase FabG [Chloroflexota bacterium]MDA8188080.1 3-oxoacyl-ACP reductase FabG [Dehalococcoidales bacterium]
MGKLDGKVVLVTGAAAGLGRAFCLKLAAEGANIAAVTGSNVDGLRETARQVQALSREAVAIKADIALEQDTLRMAEEAAARFGHIDVLVNNAAIYRGISRTPFDEIDPAEWDRVMAVNVKGPWLCARAVFPYMKRQGKGKIVNIASAVFFSGSRNWTHYVTSKGGVIGLTRALAQELGDHNICVNAVAPGLTLTEASKELMPDASTYSVARGCIKRAENAEDVVGIVAFLASDEADFISGQTIVVDGGRQLH